MLPGLSELSVEVDVGAFHEGQSALVLEELDDVFVDQLGDHFACVFSEGSAHIGLEAALVEFGAVLSKDGGEQDRVKGESGVLWVDFTVRVGTLNGPLCRFPSQFVRVGGAKNDVRHPVAYIPVQITGGVEIPGGVSQGAWSSCFEERENAPFVLPIFLQGGNGKEGAQGIKRSQVLSEFFGQRNERSGQQIRSVRGGIGPFDLFVVSTIVDLFELG